MQATLPPGRHEGVGRKATGGARKAGQVESQLHWEGSPPKSVSASNGL